MKLPKRFTVTFTREDLENAAAYGSTSKCLVATAVKRTLKVGTDVKITEGVDRLWVDGTIFKHRPVVSTLRHGAPVSRQAIRVWNGESYCPSVIGKKLICRQA